MVHFRHFKWINFFLLKYPNLTSQNKNLNSNHEFYSLKTYMTDLKPIQRNNNLYNAFKLMYKKINTQYIGIYIKNVKIILLTT